MARSFPDRLCPALIAATLLCLQPTLAAKVEPRIDTETELKVEGNNPQGDLNKGTLRMSDVVIRQGPTTTIRAAEARARGLKDDGGTTWDLSGGIHIEFSNVVLDADSATVAFSSQRIISVRVQGKPARFSHQQPNAVRRDGRATNIDYDARTANLRLSGGTWLSDGRSDYESPVLLYNLNSGSVSNDAAADDSGRATITIRPGQAPNIPTPRTPDRETAQ